MNNTIFSTIIVVIFGIVASFVYTKVTKKDFFGGIKMAMVVGVFGGVLGGFIFDLIFKLPLLQKLVDIPYFNILLVNQFDINFISVGLGIWLFLWLYGYVSEYTERS